MNYLSTGTGLFLVVGTLFFALAGVIGMVKEASLFWKRFFLVFFILFAFATTYQFLTSDPAQKKDIDDLAEKVERHRQNEIGADIQLANESTRFELINTKLGDSLDFRFAIRNLGPETADSLRLDYMGIGMNNGFFISPPFPNWKDTWLPQEIRLGEAYTTIGRFYTPGHEFGLRDTVIVVLRCSWANPIPKKKSPKFWYFGWNRYQGPFSVEKQYFIDQIIAYTNSFNHPFFKDYQN